ncbi:MAG: DUF3108 domain-containing protein [Pseudoxanthomonas suwonensis]|nr:DUF3108 domain-containing protein [Pseudoxanthomonas suwonensis]
MRQLMLTSALCTSLVLGAAPPATAQVQPQPAPQAEAASEPAITVIEPLDRAAAFAEHPLEPFVASYEVYNKGRRLGEATMELVRGSNNRWRIDLNMRGTGLLRLTGLNAEQSVVFEEREGQLLPISQATSQRALVSNRRQVGVYDWKARRATWRGDVRESRRDPVPLQDGDMPGLLINLAVIRDASPGVRLRYRYVDGGRAREHIYQAESATDGYEAGEIGYQALRLQRGDASDGTELWVASGVPTPLRVLQHEDGADGIDLRLIEYK